ncbi:MAG: cysteine synthase family protein [Flavobacteriales bacterium]|nr:cysteine synthase family protein [Flavobacteriales bacterium]MCB9446934.1 cysteine synthase family protein [Flavobacteriales bacterium]
MSTLTASQTDLLRHSEALATFVGNTPLFPITRVFSKPGVRIFAKLEWQQMGQSVKARPAFRILQEALRAGLVSPEKGLLDATSGNTGIAYATFGAALGIPVTLCLPENASEERKTILKSLGVNIVYTSRFEGTDGAQEKARELMKEHPDRYYYADQYGNNNNWLAHYETTAQEVLEQTSGTITHFVAGLGTTGTFTGTGRKLKETNAAIQLVGLQPDTAMHGLEGWKHLETAVVPAIYDSTLADAVLDVDTLGAYELIKETARKEGLLISPSAAANLQGAIKVANSIDKGTIVTVFADNGDKYHDVYKQIF